MITMKVVAMAFGKLSIRYFVLYRSTQTLSESKSNQYIKALAGGIKTDEIDSRMTSVRDINQMFFDF